MTTRYEKGLNEFERIHGATGKEKLNELAKISDDFAHLMIENIGDIYSRKIIDTKLQCAITLASQVTQGSSELELHFNVALNIGYTPEQVKEMILHLTLYCGYPKCVNALVVLEKVLNNRKI